MEIKDIKKSYWKWTILSWICEIPAYTLSQTIFYLLAHREEI